MNRRIELPLTLGRYQLVAELARGGMATVYLARMVGKAGFERLMAVKVLHPHLSSDPSFTAMFIDEARLAARIRHPNVVDVYDVDALGGELLIVMGYVEGISLARMIRALDSEETKLPIGFALRVMHETLLGLHAAHELSDASGQLLNLVHRDVSPHNLIVGTDGITRVADFGVAKARGRIATTADDVVKGKLRYLAPEQLTHGQLDRRVDVFAAGAVLWEALVGRVLFKADSEAETISMVLSGKIPRPSSLRRDIPPLLDDMVMTALERDPQQRFQTAADFADAIEATFAQELYTSRRVGKLVTEIAGARLAQQRRISQQNMQRAEAIAPPAHDTCDPLLSSFVSDFASPLPAFAKPRLQVPRPRVEQTSSPTDGGSRHSESRKTVPTEPPGRVAALRPRMESDRGRTSLPTVETRRVPLPAARAQAEVLALTEPQAEALAQEELPALTEAQAEALAQDTDGAEPSYRLPIFGTADDLRRDASAMTADPEFIELTPGTRQIRRARTFAARILLAAAACAVLGFLGARWSASARAAESGEASDRGRSESSERAARGDAPIVVSEDAMPSPASGTPTRVAPRLSATTQSREPKSRQSTPPVGERAPTAGEKVSAPGNRAPTPRAFVPTEL